MAKISAETQQALSLVAHASMSKQLDREVFAKHGASGFYEFWEKSLKPSERAILNELGRLQQKAYADLAKMLEKDAG